MKARIASTTGLVSACRLASRTAAFYRIDATERGQSPEERVTFRQREIRPLLDELRDYIQANKRRFSICRAFGFIRKCNVTDGARVDGRTLRDIVPNDNTASDVWGDTACRSQANEAWLERQGRVSRIHRRKPKGKPMPERTAKANAAKSRVRVRAEHVFAQQKDQMGLFIRTIGLHRAEAKITLANMAYHMNRLIFHERRPAMG